MSNTALLSKYFDKIDCKELKDYYLEKNYYISGNDPDKLPRNKCEDPAVRDLQPRGNVYALQRQQLYTRLAQELCQREMRRELG